MNKAIRAIFLALALAFHGSSQEIFKPVPDREGEALPPDAKISGQAQPPPSPMAWWYRSPATKFWEGVPLGCGRFAAMVYGRVRDEIIPFNDATLWSGQPYNAVNPNALKALPEIRRLALEGKFTEASKLATNLLSYPVPSVQTYQPMGRLHVRFEGHDAVEDYRRELDMDSAIARVTYRIGDAHFTREIFASYPDQVVVMRIACDRPGQITLNTSLSTLHKATTCRTVSPGTILIEGGVNEPDRKLPSLMKWQGRVRVQAEGGTVRNTNDASGLCVSVEKSDAVTIILAGATNYRNWNELGADPDVLCAKYLNAASERSFADLKKRHLDDYQPLFRACALNLGTNAAAALDTTTRLDQLRKGGTDPHFTAQYFQYGRYLLLAGSRPGTLAFNNHNIWLDSLQGRWQGRWTLNINIQECYWPAENASLAETAEALHTFVENLAASGSRTAKELYGCRGWCAHHGTDIWMNTAVTDGITWGMTPMMGAWVLQSLWEHYLFDPNPAYLARLYPLLKGAAEFGLDYLVEEPTHKWLVTCPSASPENAFRANGIQSALCAGPALDSELLRDLFSECIAASEKLGVDENFRGQLKAALLRLPPLQIGKQGQLLEWLEEYPEPEPDHRHVSHLYAAYPSDQITPRGTPDLAAAVRKTLERRGDNHGWSAAWKINLYARLGDAEAAYRVLRNLETEISIHPSRQDSDRVPSMEGNQGIQAFTAGIVEMLLQSHTGEIELLPALSKEWPEGSVKGLRARGGFRVGLVWKAGKLSFAAVLAKYAGPCRLRVAVPILVKKENQEVAVRRIDANTIEFSAEANTVYSITPRL